MTNLLHNSDLGRLVLRLTVGGLMIFHGIDKIMNPGSVDYIGGIIAGHGLPAVLAYAVYIGEVIAPALVIAGYHCRIGGLLIAINMTIAILLMHASELFLLTEFGGWALELQGFYLFGGLAIAFLGGGRFGLKPHS